jgi:hypothetical protein
LLDLRRFQQRFLRLGAEVVEERLHDLEVVAFVR